MADSKQVPKMRFSGFDGSWIKRNLGFDVADIVGGGTPSTQNPEYWNGDIDWYSPTEIGNAVYACDSVKKITNLGLKHSSAQLLPANKTILFTSRAGIGDMAILQNPGATNQGFQSLILKEGYDTYFVYSMRFLIKKFAEKYSSGSTFLEISGKKLGMMEASIPSEQEQTKIGELFKNLDTLINQHQTRVAQLANVKKSMLDKMFPKAGADVPEVRLGHGEWVTAKFNAQLEFSVSSNTLSRADLNNEIGSVKNIHYGDVLIKFGPHTNLEVDEIPYITSSVGIDFRSQYLRNGDVIFADAAEDSTVGKATEIINTKNFPVVAGLHTIAARPKNSFAPYFLGYYLNSNAYHNQLIQLMQGTKVLSISRTSLAKTHLLYPASKEEQTKIGQFFQNFDTLIAQNQKALDQLKNIKQALLHKMFV